MNAMGRVVVAVPLALLLGLSPAQAGPNVVVSVLPIHSLVAGVMQGIAAPSLILKGGASPHTYALKPSDARKLQNADAVFWVGDGLESFLAKPIQALAQNARIVTLSAVQSIHLLAIRKNGVWTGNTHQHAGRDEVPHEPAVGTNDGHHPDPLGSGRYDPHIWLDPANAAAIVVTAVAVLSGIDQSHARTYQANGATLLRRIERLETTLYRHFASVKQHPYVVFHDAYQYFETSFGLQPIGSISIAPERIPGAKRLAALRHRMRALEATCIFAEPQFKPAIVATVAEGTGARIGVLDPLGTSLASGPNAYFRLMENLAVSLRTCLAIPS